MILKLIIICVVFVVVGCFAIRPIVKSELAKFKAAGNEINLRKYYFRIMIAIAVFEIFFVVSSALWCGIDNMFDDPYFTITVSVLSCPISTWIVWHLKKLLNVKNKTVSLIIEFGVLYVVISSVYSVLPYFGFAPV